MSELFRPFLWHGEQHEVQVACRDDQYFGWFDVTVGVGTMREGGSWTFHELVMHWETQMRKWDN
jgi:hypothetical protein